jgi:hypothetical protein
MVTGHGVKARGFLALTGAIAAGVQADEAVEVEA